MNRPIRLRFALALAILGLSLAVSILAITSSFPHSQPAAAISATTVDDFFTPVAAEPQLSFVPTPIMPGRKVFPYSVIAGGALSGAELRDALLHDSVAAEHYAGFHGESTRVVRLARDRQAYVSYRLGNRIYWTAHKITLPAGETMLSDGTHMARTRCGNRISDLPGTPTHPSEPNESVMNAPIAPRFPDLDSEPIAGDPLWDSSSISLALSPGMLSPSSPSPTGGTGGTFPLPPYGCCSNAIFASGKPSTPATSPPPPIVGTPEPASWQLLAIGFAGLVLLLKLRRVQTDSWQFARILGRSAPSRLVRSRNHLLVFPLADRNDLTGMKPTLGKHI